MDSTTLIRVLTGSKSEHMLSTDKRDSLSETSEVHSDIGISSFNTRQPIWLRFLKEYNPINNAWSCFQPYRATVGLLAFAWCSSHSDIELRVKDYIKQKVSFIKYAGLFFMFTQLGFSDMVIPLYFDFSS